MPTVDDIVDSGTDRNLGWIVSLYAASVSHSDMLDGFHDDLARAYRRCVLICEPRALLRRSAARCEAEVPALRQHAIVGDAGSSKTQLRIARDRVRVILGQLHPS